MLFTRVHTYICTQRGYLRVPGTSICIPARRWSPPHGGPPLRDGPERASNAFENTSTLWHAARPSSLRGHEKLSSHSEVPLRRRTSQSVMQCTPQSAMCINPVSHIHSCGDRCHLATSRPSPPPFSGNNYNDTLTSFLSHSVKEYNLIL